LCSAAIEGQDVIEPNRESSGEAQRTFKVGEPVFLSGTAMNGRTPVERVEYLLRSILV
jgi:hypothetical protein